MDAVLLAVASAFLFGAMTVAIRIALRRGALAETARRRHAEAQRRVHRDRDGDESGPGGAGERVLVEGIDREVEAGRLEAGAAQEGRRRREREGLPAELVTGDEEDVAGRSHFAAGGL